jgi:biotin-(acetyl-CoA carboxylase) ligase
VESVARQIQEYFFIWYAKLQAGCFNEIDTNYYSQLFRANEWTLFSKEGKTFESKITGIGEFGQIILEDRAGVSSEYMFKEVEFVI